MRYRQLLHIQVQIPVGDMWFSSYFVFFLVVISQSKGEYKHYKMKQDVLNTILKNYDAAAAEEDFIRRNGTIYHTVAYIDIKDLSEKTYLATAKVHVGFAWRDRVLKQWNASDFGQISALEISKDKKIWVPGIWMDGKVAMSPIFKMIRRDQLVYISMDYHADILCWPNSLSFFPHEKLYCRLVLYTTKELGSVKFKCRKSFYSAIYNNISIDLADLPSCDKKTYNVFADSFINYFLKLSLPKWKVTKYFQRSMQSRIRIYFQMTRQTSVVFATDVAGTFAVAVILACQFLTPLRHGHRLLVIVLGILVAMQNVDIAAELRGVISFGAPNLTQLDLALLMMHTLALVWCLIAWNLQARSPSSQTLPHTCQAICTKKIGNWFSRGIAAVQTRHRQLIRMQRLVEEDDEEHMGNEDDQQGNGEESAPDSDQWSWEDLILLVDRGLCAISVIVIIILFCVFDI